MRVELSRQGEDLPSLKTALWVALLTGASVLATFILACATPFAAFGALAALHMRRSSGLALMVAVWLASQAVGFGFLHYPHTVNTYAWGPALLLAALAGTAAAYGLDSRVRRAPFLLRTVCVLFAALVAVEGADFAAGLLLGGNAETFKPTVLLNIAWTNALTCAVLLMLHRLGMAVGLIPEAVLPWCGSASR